MSEHHESAAALFAKGVIPGSYTGATLLGITMPDWAAIMAGVVSLCILIQYVWRSGHYVYVTFFKPKNPRRRATDA